MSAPKTAYFGDPKFRKDWERQIEAPVGMVCPFCEEAIGPDDTGTVDLAGHAIHYECQMRAAIGSVGHLMGRCSCHGGSDEDPPGLTKRQAAQAVVNLWNRWYA